jgi:hypothetical protein
MDFLRRLLPLLRAAGWIMLGLCLALVIAYVADRLSDRNTDAPAKTSVASVEKQKNAWDRTPEQEKEARLFGWDTPYRRRIGELIVDADMCLLANFRTHFLADFKAAFGSRVSRATLTAPSRENVLEVIMRELSGHGAERLHVAESDLRAIAEYLAQTLAPDKESRHYFWNTVFKAEKNKEGFWSVYLVTDWKESDQIISNRKGVEPDEKLFREALGRLPMAYGLYLSSLVAGRRQGISYMDNLLALPDREQHGLRAIAKYRRARLTMSLEDWDELTDEQARRRLAAIRKDLESVATHTAEGSLDPQLISLNTRYWLAYSRSMILPAKRLRQMGEDDFPGAFATYLAMPERDEANAVNSSYRLAAHLCASCDYAGCLNDPDLRRLITFYLCAEGASGYGQYPSESLLAKQTEAWLDALAGSVDGYSFDPLRIAILQYRLRRWADCLATLRLVPADHPMRALLRSRCALRLSGDLRKAGELLRPDADEAGALASLPRSGTSLMNPSENDFTILVDLEAQDEMRNRAKGELGVVRLVQGDFMEAFRLFTAGKYLKEANYVGECLLKTDELKTMLDGDPKLQHEPVEAARKTEERYPWEERITTPRALLASKLFRAGRLEEALPYVAPRLRADATNYVLLLRLAERTDTSPQVRADAYWRCSCLIRNLGEDILRAPVGLNWSSYVDNKQNENNWHVPYYFIPHIRLNVVDEHAPTPGNVLLSASKEEALRVQAWLDEHVDKPKRSERDARYAAFDLALKAARLLPDNDPAGAQILQYAGNLLKYREPKAATPAYRLLVTRFPQTPYGAYALKAHWFSPERPMPPSDIISK